MVSAGLWQRTRNAVRGDTRAVFDHVDGPHRLFPALFLKDALERSGFPPR